MGYYLEHTPKGTRLPKVGKADALIADGAKEIINPVFGPNLVCVVENGAFDATAYCYSKQEFRRFLQPGDLRRKRWLIVQGAATLSGYIPSEV